MACFVSKVTSSPRSIQPKISARKCSLKTANGSEFIELTSYAQLVSMNGRCPLFYRRFVMLPCAALFLMAYKQPLIILIILQPVTFATQEDFYVVGRPSCWLTPCRSILVLYCSHEQLKWFKNPRVRRDLIDYIKSDRILITWVIDGVRCCPEHIPTSRPRFSFVWALIDISVSNHKLGHRTPDVFANYEEDCLCFALEISKTRIHMS